MVDAEKYPARTWADHGWPSYGTWQGLGPSLGPALLDFVGRPCLLSTSGLLGMVRIDFAGGTSYQLEKNTPFRIGPMPSVCCQRRFAGVSGRSASFLVAGLIAPWRLMTCAKCGAADTDLTDPDNVGVTGVAEDSGVCADQTACAAREGDPERWVLEPCIGGCGQPVRLPARYSGTGICALCPVPAAAKAAAPDRMAQQLATFSPAAHGLSAGFDQAALEHLAEQVEKRRRFRFRKGKADGLLAELRDVLVEALNLAKLKRRPRPTAGVLRLYESLDSDVPMQVVFSDGVRGTAIAVGAEFRLPDETPAGNYYVEDSTGVRVPMAFLARARSVLDGEAGLTQESWTTSDGGLR